MQKLLTATCGVVAALALFAIMTLTFFDVGGRKLLSESIPGSLELTELLMVVVIFTSLPLVSQRGEHVVFDSLDTHLGVRWLRAQAVLVHILCALLMLALGVVMWQSGNQFALAGETTAQLKIPKAPFVYGMAVLCSLTGLVHLAQIFRPAKALAEGEGVAL